MKKVFLVLLTLCLGLGFQAQAQGGGKKKAVAGTSTNVSQSEEDDDDDNDARKTPTEIAQKRAAKLKADLGLSDEQTQKVQAILANAMTEMRKIKTSAASPDEKKAQLKGVREQKQRDMKAALTEAQYAKWVELKKAHHGDNGQGKGKGKGKK
jgi:hypothetical protein